MKVIEVRADIWMAAIIEPTLWIAWCPKCNHVRQFGGLFRENGWPYCDICRDTLWEWVPPDKGEGVLRVWLEKEMKSETI